MRVDVLREGIAELSASTGIPAGWSVETVTGLLELHQVGKRAGVTSVELKIESVVAAIDEQLASNATGSIRPSRPVLGSVRGELYRYNGRQRTAALSQSGTAKLVTVTFPAALAGEVRGALDRQVEVWGEVSRDVYDDIESIALSGLDIVEAPKTRVALDDVVGLFGAEWTDGLDSVERVRRQRGC
ncbi:hypothetical protein [Allokutzneria albata]|uniref:Uncharacterized protein n=1 Tax=Allokutzneria albata TaxID=211114 RepID=A0A1G9ZQJ6_ALLAB|nr:hypothetical protein [Allokutzneria albata]SDN23490.1 hypothetical protein SAMN04489726_5648 [Allokutzneria albata]